jgi:hypothetical protein
MSAVTAISRPAMQPLVVSSSLRNSSISSLMSALSKSIGFLSVEAPIVMGRAGTLSLASPGKGGLCLANRKSGLAFFFDVIFFHGGELFPAPPKKTRGPDETAHSGYKAAKKNDKRFFE